MSTRKNTPKAEATAREYLDSVLARQKKRGAPAVSKARYERALKQATASFRQLYKAAGMV